MKTNPNYWDCECEHNYIHPKSKDYCAICGAVQDDQPDSHEDEVVEYLIQNGHEN